jgi:hypothetical protein
MFRRHAPLVATGPSVGVPGGCYEGCGTQPKLLLVCKPHIRPETIEAMIAALEPALHKWPAPPRSSSSSSSSPLPPRCEVLRMSAERARTPEGLSDFAAAWGAGLPIVVTDATAGFSETYNYIILRSDLNVEEQARHYYYFASSIFQIVGPNIAPAPRCRAAWLSPAVAAPGSCLPGARSCGTRGP